MYDFPSPDGFSSPEGFPSPEGDSDLNGDPAFNHESLEGEFAVRMNPMFLDPDTLYSDLSPAYSFLAGHSEWDSEPADRVDARACVAGWLIERMGAAGRRFDEDLPRYLQLGTGQWCGAEFATLFPIRSAALIYAREFGYEPGRNVRLVWHRKQ
ncbi:MAG: hypothetical protein AAGG48_05495 [Planctomycetota bacterium]